MMVIQSTALCAREPLEECWVEVDDAASKALSDIARRLTSTRRSEKVASAIISHVARVLGGGLRTVW